MGRAQDVGQRAEDRAQARLIAHGLQPITRNYRCRGGEIDLVMRDGDCLVFVEVRFRRDRGFGGALSSIDTRKRQRLILAAEHYLARDGWRGPCRFDVVAYDGDGAETWIRDAFAA